MSTVDLNILGFGLHRPALLPIIYRYSDSSTRGCTDPGNDSKVYEQPDHIIPR
jgi:hypothetical protein